MVRTSLGSLNEETILGTVWRSCRARYPDVAPELSLGRLGRAQGRFPGFEATDAGMRIRMISSREFPIHEDELDAWT